MSDRCFIDTNILIYAHDRDAGAKQVKAAKVLEDLWERQAGVLSVQVLQEFYVNVTRKIPKPLSRAQARDVIQSYAAWPLAVNDAGSLMRASDIEERHGLSFWDSLIVAAAVELGADRLLSEDLQHGRRLEGLIVENPLR
jgi:predicted nucleic acid-binding protein